MQKIWFQRGASQKNMVCKGGFTKKIALKFSSDSVCNNANNSARRPKIAFLRFSKFKFSRGRMPPYLLLYYTPNGNSTSPIVSLQSAVRGM